MFFLYNSLFQSPIKRGLSPEFGRPGNWATRLGRAPDQFILDSWGGWVRGRDREKWREIEMWVKEIERDLRGLPCLPRLSTVFL